MSSISLDLALWPRLVAGDASAFSQVYRRHAPRVFDHCYRRTLSRADSEDLTAEVFAQAWRRRRDVRLHDTAGALPWLLVTANHLVAHRHRSLARARRMLAKAGALIPTVATDHAEAIAATDEDRHNLVVIAAVLDGLSRKDREVIQLCIIDGLSPSEVAQVTRESASSIRSRLSRALARARLAYDRATAGDGQPRRTAAPLGSIR